MTLREQIIREIRKKIIKLWPDAQALFEQGKLTVDVTYPPDQKFGHYTTNVPLRLASIAKASPQDIARDLVHSFSLPSVERAEVAGPGFINYFLKPEWLLKQVTKIIEQKKKFGTSTIGRGQRVDVEFISANPTGPLTLGNGRGAFMGDALANTMTAAGYTVRRDYYVNDMGNQVNILAESVLRRYWISQGIRMEYPDYCYQGAYIEDIAKTLYLPNYNLAKTTLVDVRDKIKGRILSKMIGNIQKFVAKRLGITFDEWFSEKSLYTTGKIEKMLDTLRSLDLVYEQEGALWMRTTAFGDDKDRVLIRANSEPTYFLPDIAYHHDKFSRRKFDRVINFLGADHAGYAPRLQAAMKALGHEDRLHIIVFQLVRLMSGGKEVRMSKRKGMFVTFEELVDDVGVDAARYFFLMHSPTTHMDFDLDLAKKKSQDNPVYYVQYAHARISSILSKVHGMPPAKGKVSMHGSAGRLVAKLLQYPELIEDVATTYTINKLPTYAYELATLFHEFYTNVRVIDNAQVHLQPLAIITATQIVLANVLKIMGITAPEKM